MSSAASLKTRCPVCNRRYEIPASAAGHKVRCSQCQTVFRVPAPPAVRPAPAGPADKAVKTSTHRPAAPAAGPSPASDAARAREPRPPTEDDILRWLSEGEEDPDAPPPLPRGARPATRAAQSSAPGQPQASTHPSDPPSDVAAASDPTAPASERTGDPIRLEDLRAGRLATPPANPAPLRKTG